MSTGQIIFPTPSTANKELTAAAGKSYITTLRQQALAQWWGNFVPIDQWTPPAVKPMFEGQRFQRYDMSLETRLETLDSNFGDSEPSTYEKHFAGVTEVIEELSAMFDKGWARTLPALTGRSPTPSVDEELEVDQLMDDDSPSYDLGWTPLPAPTENDVSADEEPSYNLGWDNTMQDDGPHTDMEAAKASGDQNAEGPAYDLGWGALPSVEEGAADDDNDDEDGPTYDLGWGVTPSVNEVAARDGHDDADGPTYDLEWGAPPSVEEVAARDGHDDADGPTYDLGWGAPPSVEEVVVRDGRDDGDGPTYDLGWGVPPSVEDAAAGDGHGDDDGPTYDLGWGQPVDTPTVGDVALAAETDDVIDLTSDDIVSRASVVDQDEDIIDLTEDDGLSPLSQVTSQPGNKEMVAPEGDTTGAELLHRINRRLKMIGSTMDDDHAQAIVENAVLGSTDDRVPAAIVLENRQLLGWFSDTRDRVTGISQDMSDLHRLLQFQCRMLKTVNQVISSLETEQQQ
ncbi:hypothetical protein P692DRAFT_20876386 [Suillus brevipes Sb2]|nr:hypothetical protein P692DRAFT_20876386 [Suillus brevipes Sb2]